MKSRRGESSYGYETEEADSENAERDAEKACHEGPENKTRFRAKEQQGGWANGPRQ